MAIRDLIRKPKLDYRPDKVVLPPENSAERRPTGGSSAASSAAQGYADLTSMLVEEIDRLDEVISAVVSTVSIAAVVVDSQVGRVIGKTEVVMSDYLASLESSDPSAQLICETYENHHAENGDAEALLLRPLHSARSRLSEAFSTMPSSMRDAFVSDTRYMRADLEEEFERLGIGSVYPGTDIDPANITQAQMQYIQRQVESAQELRAQIGEAANVCAQAINNELWPALFGTKDVHEIQEKALEFVGFLRKLRTVLMFGALTQTKQWRSVTRVLTNYVTNHIVRGQLNVLQGVYSDCYNEIVAPVREMLSDVINATERFQAKPFLGQAGDNAESAAVAINTIAHTADGIIGVVTDNIADIMILKEKQASAEVASVQVTTALLYQRRLIMLLDVVIEALLLASRQPVDIAAFSIPPGKLADATSAIGNNTPTNESNQIPIVNDSSLV